ncbi:MAG TPA: alpha/beta-hydrolase family protein [Streptosporangiaceae bacterium]|nr:alpha/beta-hydrolase family protein [Streptosporangiaceae bacterium]
MEPARIYAGLASAKGAQAQAALAVRDLECTRGFRRKNLLVVTTTGSGWVDPALVDSFEYLSNGDCATVAIQYSYLPSWVSYLVDHQEGAHRGPGALRCRLWRVAQATPCHRPNLYVSGESLGAFGGEAAFTGVQDMANRTSGILFTGPPNFSTLLRQFTDQRDPGSPEIQPVHQNGQMVRFADNPARAIPPRGKPWPATRVLYLIHPSDPIIWWSPSLIFREPDWLSGPHRPGVLPSMFWLPFIAFWQVSADLPFSTVVPAGHGHKDTAKYVGGWDAVMRPAGFTPRDLTGLRQIISAGE